MAQLKLRPSERTDDYALGRAAVGSADAGA
jgi:hypothetical protein